MPHEYRYRIRYADFIVSDAGADDTVNAMDKIKRFANDPFRNVGGSANLETTLASLNAAVFARVQPAPAAAAPAQLTGAR